MKKLGIAIFMMVIIGIYIFSIRNIGKDSNDVKGNDESGVKLKISSELQKLDEKIREEYPDTPKEVVQIHNEFMSIGYGSKMTEDDITSYVDKIRDLYSEEFKKLNSVEAQKQHLIDEINSNEKDSFTIISSDIDDVTIINDNDETEIAEVTVKHFTSQGELMRTYTLIKENEQWKICSWEND